MRRLRFSFNFSRNVVGNYNAHNNSLLAAGVAFFSLVSLFPTVLLFIILLSYILTQEESATRLRVLNYILGTMPNDDARQALLARLSKLLGNYLARRGTLLSVSGIVFVYSAIKVFDGLQTAMNVVWGVTQGRNFVMGKVVPFLAVLGMLLLIFVSIGVSAVLAGLRHTSREYLGWVPAHELLFSLLNVAVSLALIAMVLALIYRYLPATSVHWGEVWSGSIFAAILWVAAKEVFALSPRLIGYNPTYGVIGALLAFVTWIFISVQIILLGAEISAEHARCRGNPAVRPRDDAQPEDALASVGRHWEWERQPPASLSSWPAGARNVLVVLGAAVVALVAGWFGRSRDL